MNVGMHGRVFEYDGAFRCLDCHERWGALPDNPPEPERCVPKPPPECPRCHQTEQCRDAWHATPLVSVNVDEIARELVDSAFAYIPDDDKKLWRKRFAAILKRHIPQSNQVTK